MSASRAIPKARFPGACQFALAIIVLLLSSSSLFAEIKALWLTAWDFNSPAKIDEAVNFAREHGFSQILVHARYRGDALYQPNRIDATFPNPEPISYILTDQSFDPLAYILEKTAAEKIEIHAWVTVFVVTPRKMGNVSPDHIYYTKPEWITSDFFEKRMEPDSYEGAFLDAGIPEVHDYLLNVFKDIVVNYDVAGLHLDYIRYPDNQFGYAPAAVENYYQNAVPPPSLLSSSMHSPAAGKDIHSWKEEQITRFVRRCYAEIKTLKPDLLLSAAVISNLERANSRYSQNWLKWLAEGIIDYAYTMTYGLTDNAVAADLAAFQQQPERIIIGLRAWSESNRPFGSSDLISKINLVRENGFAGLAYFSYSGIKPMMNTKLSAVLQQTPASFSAHSPNRFIYGYVTAAKGESLPNTYLSLDAAGFRLSDSNGFFLFSRLSGLTHTLKAENGITVFISDAITFPEIPDNTPKIYNITLPSRESR